MFPFVNVGRPPDICRTAWDIFQETPPFPLLCTDSCRTIMVEVVPVVGLAVVWGLMALAFLVDEGPDGRWVWKWGA